MHATIYSTKFHLGHGRVEIECVVNMQKILSVKMNVFHIYVYIWIYVDNKTSSSK